MKTLPLALPLLLFSETPATTPPDDREPRELSTSGDRMPDCPQQKSPADYSGTIEKRNLDQLPPADTYMAVLRTDDEGCLDPLLASELRDRRR